MPNPTMLYKSGGKHKIHGGNFDYKIVDADNEEEFDAALSDGWLKTTIEAAESKSLKTEAVSEPESTGLESKTREELEAIAEAMEADNEGLNIAFNSRTDDETLRERIIAAKASLEQAE